MTTACSQPPHVAMCLWQCSVLEGLFTCQYLTSALLLQVIHLGKHQLCPEWPEPQHLYEVMPTVLAERKFGKPRTMRRVEMGYREAPEAGTPMVVVFVKVRSCICSSKLVKWLCPRQAAQASALILCNAACT